MVHETCGEKCSNGAPKKKIVLIIYLYHMMWTLSYGLISPRFKLVINQLRKQ